MPRIWTDTIESHRQQVHDAILDATADLVDEAGPMSVTMSAIADRAGIGRATLYKYFPDVESILIAWHSRQFGDRLAQLGVLRASPVVSLDDLVAFALQQRTHRRHHGSSGVVGNLAQALAAPSPKMPDSVEEHVVGALSDVMDQLARRGEARSDVGVDVLARWVLHCIHAPVDIDDGALATLLKASLAATRAGPRPARRRP
jgi:AcrR family transcriptional regulator